ncbi:putative drug resistance transporter [Mobilicoccus pelagius NBRC 104925]|uniref:Putative drug resistance transporter n=2 Tax=Mobilicoccus TaxID=984996 RepID=H5UV62_9MICO|nr:putative drug resistance transporter [Mobilicoccus pelagius NBRC 104925]
MAVLMTPLFMALVAVSVINVALPSIQHSLHATSTALQWVLSGYALAFGVLLIPAGRAGDATSRRTLFIVGVSLFTLGSALAAFAPTILLLNLARVLQGVGSGVLNPQTVGIIQRTFTGQDRARAFALLGTTVGVSTAIGPVVGGLLIGALGEGVGWRWIFGMNVPIGILAVVGAVVWLPRGESWRGSRPDLDPVGAGLLALTVLGLMLPFVERTVSPFVWLALPVAIGVGVAWVMWEDRYARRGGEPMVRLGIFSERGFTAGITLITVYFMGITSVWVVVALFVQTALGGSALEAGLVGLPASIFSAISSQVAGRYVLRFRRRLVVWGFLVSLLGLVSTVLLAPGVGSGALPLWAMSASLSLVGAAQGMVVSPNQTLTLDGVGPEYGGVAGGILQTGQRLGAAVGTALIPGIVFALLEAGLAWGEVVVVAMSLIAAVTTVALVIALVDLRHERSTRRG